MAAVEEPSHLDMAATLLPDAAAEPDPMNVHDDFILEVTQEQSQQILQVEQAFDLHMDTIRPLEETNNPAYIQAFVNLMRWRHAAMDAILGQPNVEFPTHVIWQDVIAQRPTR